LPQNCPLRDFRETPFSWKKSQLSHLGRDLWANFGSPIFSGKTGFFENLTRENFVGNLMGYKFCPVSFSGKSSFPGENRDFPKTPPFCKKLDFAKL
jgi:hypothetical protein